MSEIIDVQPGSTTSQFGIQVTSNQVIRLVRDTSTGVVTAFGSSSGDTIAPAASPAAAGLTVFNLRGEGGNDNLTGGAASDTISGGVGADVLSGGGGGDLLDGGQGNDRISGDAGNDIILAGDGRDILSGGNGRDLLNPGAGRDVLISGAGRDTLQFAPGSTGQGEVDRVRDFNPRQDTIRLSRRLLPRSGLPVTRSNAPLNAEAFKAVDSIGTFDRDDVARIIYDRSTGLVYYNNPRNDDLVQLLQLSRNLNLGSRNFEIF